MRFKLEKREPVLLETDLKIIDYIFKYKTATSYQIHRDVLSNILKNKESSRVKLGRLRQKKILDNKYNRELEHIKHFGLTKASIFNNMGSLFNRRIIRHDIDDIGVTTNSYCPIHDLKLLEIWKNMGRMNEVSKYWTENDYLLRMGRKEEVLRDRLNGLRPDGIILYEGENGQKKIFALEYERSYKSNDRYYNLFHRYKENDAIDAVLYICEKQHTLNKLSNFQKDVIYSKDGCPKFYYCNANNFFRESEVIFTNSSEDTIAFNCYNSTAYLDDKTLFGTGALNLLQSIKILRKNEAAKFKARILSDTGMPLEKTPSFS